MATAEGSGTALASSVTGLGWGAEPLEGFCDPCAGMTDAAQLCSYWPTVLDRIRETAASSCTRSAVVGCRCELDGSDAKSSSSASPPKAKPLERIHPAQIKAATIDFICFPDEVAGTEKRRRV